MRAETALRGHALLGAATRILADGGTAEPRREALRLWQELSGQHTADLLLRAEEPVPPELASNLLAAAARRARGEPLAHIVGRVGFRRLELRSDGRALIPRPETEGLVELILGRVGRGRAADVGTGTGALALSLAQEGGFDVVSGIDVSPEALELAGENRRATGLSVELVRGDLCEPLRDGAVDALVSNPPYLTEGEYATLDPAVREWEPRLALASGPDGMDATGRLLEDARRVVRPGGWIAIEVDCARAHPAARRAGELGWDEIALHADLFGRERYLLARRSPTS